MSGFRVQAEWDETGWWVLTSPDAPGAVSQCRRLEQAAADMAEAIGLITGHEVTEDHITLSWHVPGQAGQAAEAARAERQQADQATARAVEHARAATGQLRQAGFSFRDIGYMLGMSYQRAQQIAGEASTRQRHNDAA